jgi:hypothetical protein
LRYAYEIVYKPDKENAIADVLSCMTKSPCLDTYVPQTQVWNNIKEEVVSYPYMQKIGKMATKNLDSPYTW